MNLPPSTDIISIDIPPAASVLSSFCKVALTFVLLHEGSSPTITNKHSDEDKKIFFISVLI
jgi:hypothetical protein